MKHARVEEEQFLADLERLKGGPPLVLTLGTGPALVLLANLQLALRHPGNNGPSSELVRRMAKALEAYVGQTPVLAAGCAMGWDPECDVPPENA